VIVWLLTAVAGGFGAVTRFVMEAVLRRVSGPSWLSLMIINVSGSLLLGLIAGLTAGGLVPQQARMVAGGGFLGGYTTFSSATVETVRLLEDRSNLAALISSLGMLLASVAAAAVGLVVGLGGLQGA
jgi:fluoride exporter